jgi:hypothetical protein
MELVLEFSPQSEISPASPDTDAHPNPSPTSSSSFLRLSPELRNAIYHHLYTSSTIHLGNETPGLLLTCKQIYNECIELFYVATAFYVEEWETLTRWLKHLPQQRRRLITEIWCGQKMALPDAALDNVTCHGVLGRMGRRLKNIGLGLNGDDILRSMVTVDAGFVVWSSDPMLVWTVVREAFLDRLVSIPINEERGLYAMSSLRRKRTSSNSICHRQDKSVIRRVPEICPKWTQYVWTL